MKNIQIISASQTNKYSLLMESWDQDSFPEIQVRLNQNNTLPLAQVYNKYLTSEYENDYLIFCHDDLQIEDMFLIDKINEAMKTYDIVGLAGMKAPITIKPPCLWHLMGERQNMSGAVAHFDKTSNKRFMTTYGPTPERVIMLDGVFMAVNVKRILEKGLRFDENNPAGFHFYDIMFCLDANKLGLKCGTWPIWCTHKSHGLEKPTEDWIKGQQYFLQKYNS